MSQSYTIDCFDKDHVGQIDLQNMENNFAALKSCFGGATNPATLGFAEAGMWWFDSDNLLLKVRNSGNTGWITVVDLANDRIDSDAITADSFSSSFRKPSLIAGETIAPGSCSLRYAGPDDFIVGDYQIARSVSLQVTSSMTKECEIIISRDGNVRVKTVISPAMGATVNAQVYINGSPAGTYLTKTAYYVSTEDFTGLSADDLVQVYAISAGGVGDSSITQYLCVGNPQEAGGALSI